MKDRLRRISLLLLVVLLSFTLAPLSFADGGDDHDIEWWNFRNTSDNNAVTDRPTPTNDQEAWGKWQVKVGTNYTSTAPTPPIIVDNKLYVATGKVIQELDKETGAVIRTSEEMPAGAGYAMQSPVYADGKIFVAITNGRICAVNIDDLSVAWVTDNTNILKGQTVSPISYVKIGDKGYVHTGTWVANGGAGDLICATTDDEDVVIDAKGNKIKSLVWSFNPNVVDKENLEANNSVALGYYWTGAYVTDKYLAIGSDNGSTMGDYVNDTAFYTLNPLTGEIIDAIYGIKGQVRSTAVYYNGCLYFTTKGAKVYKVPVDENGNLGEPSYIDLGEFDAVATTATVVVHNGKIYLGLQGKGGQFNSDGGHGFMVMRDDEVLSQDSFMYTIPVPGYPQAGALLSTYHEDEDFNGDGEADGRVYLFFTYNAPPGGLFYTYDTPNQTEPTALSVEESKIFIPSSGKQQFCISSIVVDREGNLYYKNDSAHLFCVESNPAILSGIELFDDEDANVPIDQVFMPKIGEYSATLRSDAESARVVLQLEDGVTATVAGQEYIDGGVVLPMEEDELDIEIRTNKSGKGRTYSLVVHKAGINADLSSLASAINNTVPSSSNKNTRVITPAFDKDVLEYTFDWITTGTGNSSGSVIDPATKAQMNIFLKPASENATVKVWPGENIKEGNGGSSTLNSDGSIKGAAITNATYSLRFPLYSNDVTRDSTATIVVTAEDGITQKTYNITFSRRVYVAEVILSEKETMTEGETLKLEANINPPNATDQVLTWESSDESVVTVDEEGNVTAVGVGTATITATSSDGPFGETLIEVNHDLITQDKVDATCEEDGSIEYWQCSVCEKIFADAEAKEEISEADLVVPALDHDWDEGVEIPATCEEAGLRTYTCNRDSSHTREEPIGAIGHNWNDGEVETPVTCEEDGLMIYTCSHDSSHTYEVIIEKTGHDWDEGEVVTEADCETEGEIIYTCQNNGEHKKTETVAALGHDYTETVVTEATCTEPGRISYECSRNAEHNHTEEIDALGHKMTAVEKAATCEVEGILLHYDCERCQKLFVDEEGLQEITDADSLIVPAIGHNWDDGEETTAPSCEGAGVKTFTCQTCEKTKTESIDAEGHKWMTEKTIDTEPTCIQEGSKSIHCEVCDAIDAETIETIEAIGHDYSQSSITTEPSCTTAGVKTWVCSRDESHRYTEDIPATGHDINSVEKVDATCTTQGTQAHYECGECHALFSDAEGNSQVTLSALTIPAKGHSWDNGKITKVATCTEKGEKTFTCKNDSSHTKKEAIPATGHSWDNGKITKQPTCTATGVKTFTCINDKNHTRTETVAKTAHKTVLVKEVKATRLKTGTKAHYKCSVCGKLFSNSAGTNEVTAASLTIPALGLDTPKISSAVNTVNGPKIVWTKSLEAKGYSIYTKGSSGSLTKIGYVSGESTLNYTHADAVSGRKYTYVVRAEAGSIVSGNSAGKAITYLATPRITACANTVNGPKITWTKSAGAKGYLIYTKASNGNLTKVGYVSGDSVLNYIHATAASGKQYTYIVRADGDVLSSYYAAGKTINYLAAPRITAAANTINGPKITWSKSAGAKGYIIYTKASNGTLTKIGYVSGDSTLNYIHAKAVSGTTYTFVVRADGTAMSSYYAAGKAVTYLEAPRIASLSNTKTGPKLGWNKIKGAAGYVILRKEGSGAYKTIKTITGGNIVTYTDTTAVKGKTYTYAVRANGNNMSSYYAAGKTIKCNK